MGQTESKGEEQTTVEEEKTDEVEIGKKVNQDEKVGEICRGHDLTTSHEDVPALFNVIGAPKNCPAGYRLDAHGKCRRIL